MKPAPKDIETEAGELMLDAEDLGPPDDPLDQVYPMCHPSFLQAISDAGIKFTDTFHPHDCPIHAKQQHLGKKNLCGQLPRRS